VDLEVGVVAPAAGPEVKAPALFRDRFIGVMRRKHPLAGNTMTLRRYAQGEHVEVSQHAGGNALGQGPVDEVLEGQGVQRNVVAVVGGFSAALALVGASDLIATVPEKHTAGLRAGLRAFPLPFEMAPVTVSLQWHPRLDADPAHRWVREVVRRVCAKAAGQPSHPLA
jgi:DNA-binding transcriptional LysR family regulator